MKDCFLSSCVEEKSCLSFEIVFFVRSFPFIKYAERISILFFYPGHFFNEESKTRTTAKTNLR